MLKSLNVVDSFISKNLPNLLVPLTRLNRGEANKVIEEVKEMGAKIICKNNKPECAIVSFEKYLNMVDDLQKYEQFIKQKEEDELMVLAKQRLENFDSEETFGREELMLKYNISENDLECIEVEFE